MRTGPHTLETIERIREATLAHHAAQREAAGEPREREPIEDDAEPRHHGGRHSLHPGSAASARRTMDRQDARERQGEISAGIFPGFAASMQRDGRWVAVIMINVAVHKYKRHESIARFATSDEAYAAAERWLKRKTAPR